MLYSRLCLEYPARISVMVNLETYSSARLVQVRKFCKEVLVLSHRKPRERTESEGLVAENSKLYSSRGTRCGVKRDFGGTYLAVQVSTLVDHMNESTNISPLSCLD
jgi:hypothetical protein